MTDKLIDGRDSLLIEGVTNGWTGGLTSLFILTLSMSSRLYDGGVDDDNGGGGGGGGGDGGGGGCW